MTPLRPAFSSSLSLTTTPLTASLGSCGAVQTPSQLPYLPPPCTPRLPRPTPQPRLLTPLHPQLLLPLLPLHRSPLRPACRMSCCYTGTMGLGLGRGGPRTQSRRLLRCPGGAQKASLRR